MKMRYCILLAGFFFIQNLSAEKLYSDDSEIPGQRYNSGDIYPGYVKNPRYKPYALDISPLYAKPVGALSDRSSNAFGYDAGFSFHNFFGKHADIRVNQSYVIMQSKDEGGKAYQLAFGGRLSYRFYLGSSIFFLPSFTTGPVLYSREYQDNGKSEKDDTFSPYLFPAVSIIGFSGKYRLQLSFGYFLFFDSGHTYSMVQSSIGLSKYF